IAHKVYRIDHACTPKLIIIDFRILRGLPVYVSLYTKVHCDFWIRIQAAQKTQRRGARRSMSGGVLFCTLTRNRSSATKHMSFFSSLLVSSPSARRFGSPTNGVAWVAHRDRGSNDHKACGSCRFFAASRSIFRETARIPNLADPPDRRVGNESPADVVSPLKKPGRAAYSTSPVRQGKLLRPRVPRPVKKSRLRPSGSGTIANRGNSR